MWGRQERTYLSDQAQPNVNSGCCPLRPRTTPSPEERSILGVIYGVLLWADMNAATPLGAWGRYVISLAVADQCVQHEPNTMPL